MSQLFLGFDAGTQSVKVAVYDASFKCLTSHSKPTTLHYPNPGWVQMDPDEYVRITVECIAACVTDIKGLGYTPGDIGAVMGDGIICGITGVDEDGNAYLYFGGGIPDGKAADPGSAPRPTWTPSRPWIWTSGAGKPAIRSRAACFPRCSPAGS